MLVMAIKKPKLAAIVNLEPAAPNTGLSAVLRSFTEAIDRDTASGIPVSDVPHIVDAALKLVSYVAAVDSAVLHDNVLLTCEVVAPRPLVVQPPTNTSVVVVSKLVGVRTMTE